MSTLTKIIVTLCLVWITVLSHCVCLELNSVDLKGCGSDNSLNSNASLPSVQCHRRHTERRVASWAVCFERLLQDPVGVRYFSVRWIGPSPPFAQLLQIRLQNPWSILVESTSQALCILIENVKHSDIFLTELAWVVKAFSARLHEELNKFKVSYKTTRKFLERILLSLKQRMPRECSSASESVA